MLPVVPSQLKRQLLE
jgi:hypothetical protein